MPYCACYHGYRLDPDGLVGEPLHPEDAGGILSGALGTRDGRASGELLALLRGKVIVDLAPAVDECYALGPYKVKRKSTNALVNARYGIALYKAKYRSDPEAIRAIGSELAEFAQSHPRLRLCTTVTAPPTSQARDNLPMRWATTVAGMMWAGCMAVDWKTPPSGAQKNNEGSVRGNMVAPWPIQGDALVIDDALGYGETLKEAGRALKQAGASKVYALCVAKDMRGTAYNPDDSYGIDFAEERWL